ncbi:hypothetical protein ACFXKD_18890 [Nocardiopsis aegyptia]|uniref:hypothetical protein n=1 Tax=Nocardiopsis aegyptia TaxID=220378 RepID=UPI00366E95E3
MAELGGGPARVFGTSGGAQIGLDSDDPRVPDGAQDPRDSTGSQDIGPDADDTEAAATFARVSGNFDYFFGHGLRPLSRYVPDTAALAAGTPRVVVALGRESVGQTIHGIGLALAAALATEPADFPGDHGGFESHPEDFARALERALGD